jgi:hypothetical protein
MPIKEIMTLGSIIVAGWFLTGGQRGVIQNVRKAQIAILRDVGLTSTWGSPSIFRHSALRRIPK